MKKYFVTATHTDAGKTFVSSLLVKALNAYYWKPVQSGYLDRDSDTIQEMWDYPSEKILKEAYLLKSPESPHSAAAKENLTIDLDNIVLPKVDGDLIVEGAGGLLVPLNENYTIADLILKLDLEVILVVPTYLGCINHSLLTIESLKARGIKVKALIFNGEESKDAQDYILKYLGDVISYRIPKINNQKSEELDRVVFELSQII